MSVWPSGYGVGNEIEGSLISTPGSGQVNNALMFMLM